MVSGTNAPLYTTSFSAARPKAKEELEKHEDRLAEALELDRVTRVLEFRDPSTTLLKQVPSTSLKGAEPEAKTAWKGTEWVLGGTEHSKPPCRLPVRSTHLTYHRNFDNLRNSNTSNFPFQISIHSRGIDEL